MASINANSGAQDSADVEKAATVAESLHIQGLETSPETSLERGLRPRHISMIAIGGALGTGLIIGTGKALAQAGPASLFISYVFVGILVYGVMAGLGEMAAWLPLSAGFTGYAARYCHPSLGFALGWTYLFKYVILVPNQLTAAALSVTFWNADAVHPAILISVFLGIILAINAVGGVKFFGEFEFYLSSLKVIVIVGIILFSLILASGGGPTGDAPGFRYWKDGHAFAPLYATGSLGKFLGFWSVMVNATFAFLGTELVGVTAAEAQNPRRTIPKAIKLTFFRIVIFYCVTVFLVGLLVPYDSPELAFANKQANPGASSSPFVVAAKLAQVRILPHIINACILVFVLSASNSDLYIASRTLYGLSSNGAAPACFKRTNWMGVPWIALLACSAFGSLAYMNCSSDSRKIFVYFVNLTTVFGLLTWISLLVTYICFLRGRRAQDLADEAMPYVAPQGLWGTYACLFFCVLICLTKNFSVFLGTAHTAFDYPTFITGYLGIPLYLALLFGHMLWTGSRGVAAAEADFFSGKDIIDEQEREFLESEAGRSKSGWTLFYDRYVSWLF